MSSEREQSQSDMSGLAREIMQIDPRFTMQEAEHIARNLVEQVTSHMHLGCALGCVDSKNYREPNTSVHLIQTPKDEAAIPGTLADMYSRSKLPTLIITDDNGTTFAAALKPTFGE